MGGRGRCIGRRKSGDNDSRPLGPFFFASNVREGRSMTIDIAGEKNRLSQTSTLNLIRQPLKSNDFVTVNRVEKGPHHNCGLFSALIPTAQVEGVLSKTAWDLNRGDGGPGTIEYMVDDAWKVEYHRFGNDDGIEPLILSRYFLSLRPPYCEISEEFRLFHGLYHDVKAGTFIKFDEVGNELVVARITSDRVEIRLHELRQFAAAKEMHVALFFDCIEDSTATLPELALTEDGSETVEDLMRYGLYYGDFHSVSGKNAFSRLYGKKLIPPYPKEQSDFGGFAREKPKFYENFITAVNDAGDDVRQSAGVASYTPAQPDGVFYLTPVFFRKSVLDKYYQAPTKYVVEDGYVRCAGLWSMRLDNDHPDYVMAWLGDLGRDLPHQEQLHWRAHNIPPAGGISETAYRRQVLGQWTSATSPDHVFRVRYEELRSASEATLGWPMLLPLHDRDEHFFSAIRIPHANEQKHFDELVLALTKVLVDSFNEKELVKLLPGGAGAITGGINRLEKVLAARSIPDFAPHIKFLRDLQELRSSGSAHRKGSGYEKIAEKLGIGDATLPAVFEGILVKAISLLEFLREMIASGKF